jgi:hypothetical protein
MPKPPERQCARKWGGAGGDKHGAQSALHRHRGALAACHFLLDLKKRINICDTGRLHRMLAGVAGLLSQGAGMLFIHNFPLCVLSYLDHKRRDSTLIHYNARSVPILGSAPAIASTVPPL